MDGRDLPLIDGIEWLVKKEWDRVPLETALLDVGKCPLCNGLLTITHQGWRCGCRPARTVTFSEEIS